MHLILKQLHLCRRRGECFEAHSQSILGMNFVSKHNAVYNAIGQLKTGRGCGESRLFGLSKPVRLQWRLMGLKKLFLVCQNHKSSKVSIKDEALLKKVFHGSSLPHSPAAINAFILRCKKKHSNFHFRSFLRLLAFSLLCSSINWWTWWWTKTALSKGSSTPRISIISFLPPGLKISYNKASARLKKTRCQERSILGGTYPSLGGQRSKAPGLTSPTRRSDASASCPTAQMDSAPIN